jgi:hypothetical protein
MVPGSRENHQSRIMRQACSPHCGAIIVARNPATRPGLLIGIKGRAGAGAMIEHVKIPLSP